MNAQEKWKQQYNVFMDGLSECFHDYAAERKMRRYRREAALERKLAAAERTIKELQDALEAMLEDAPDKVMHETWTQAALRRSRKLSA